MITTHTKTCCKGHTTGYGTLAACAFGMDRGLYAETLRHAARTLGGAGRLARVLAVDPLELHNWMTGKEPAPLSVFLRTLDVIADGPYARERRIRVAAIRSQDDTAPRS